MPQPNEFLGQKGDDARRAAVELRRNAFIEGSNLCDFHFGSPLSLAMSIHRTAARVRWRLEGYDARREAEDLLAAEQLAVLLLKAPIFSGS